MSLTTIFSMNGVSLVKDNQERRFVVTEEKWPALQIGDRAGLVMKHDETTVHIYGFGTYVRNTEALYAPRRRDWGEYFQEIEDRCVEDTIKRGDNPDSMREHCRKMQENPHSKRAKVFELDDNRGEITSNQCEEFLIYGPEDRIRDFIGDREVIVNPTPQD
tara:strand:- start:638 stop:1120 length:483 start_codon:yes stop_codon:yes gene_type:complete